MLTQTRLRSALLGSGAAVALLMPAAAAAGEVDTLQNQIQALQDRLDQLEQGQAAIDERTQGLAPAALLVTGGDIPGSFKLPGSDTSMAIGGQIRSDFIYDFSTNSDALGAGSFYFSVIPLDGSGGANRDGEFRFANRQTFLNITTSTPSEFGEISTFLALNFATTTTRGTNSEFTFNGFSPKLQEAYGTIGPILMGQTVSTFLDYSSYPTTLDYFGVAGETWIYQSMIRYTHDLGDGMVLKLALENPEINAVGTNVGAAVSTRTGALIYISDIAQTTSVAGTATGFTTSGGPDSYPDAVVKLNYDQSWGHLGLGAILRNLEVDNGAGAQDAALGWGTIVGLWLPTFGDDSFNAHLIYGEGIGRYVFGSITDALVRNLVPGQTPDVDPVTVWGFHVGYQHWWTDSIASNAVFGWAHTEIDTADAWGPNGTPVAAFNTNEDIQSVNANVLWYPADPVMIGLEYIFGQRHTIDGQYATASRLQMAFWYSF
ncbi:MAG: porin [Proteobacteria bacterium]|nr:porin [Pseudomonadota bacterium]